MTEYADQRAHDVFWMTADERNTLEFGIDRRNTFGPCSSSFVGQQKPQKIESFRCLIEDVERWPISQEREDYLTHLRSEWAPEQIEAERR